MYGWGDAASEFGGLLNWTVPKSKLFLHIRGCTECAKEQALSGANLKIIKWSDSDAYGSKKKSKAQVSNIPKNSNALVSNTKNISGSYLPQGSNDASI